MNDKAIIPNPLDAVEQAVAALALPKVQAIRAAFAAIAAAPGDVVVFTEQEAVIIANVNALLADAPVLIPILQSQGIAAGAGLAITELDKAIAALQAIVTPPASAAK